MLFVYGVFTGIILTAALASYSHYCYLKVLTMVARDKSSEKILGKWYYIVEVDKYSEFLGK